MSQNQAPAVTQPNYFRNAQNTGNADIPVGHLCKPVGEYPEVDLATSAGQPICGVAIETLTADGVVRSIQTDGLARVVAGGAFSRGDDLTTDSQGRAIAATAVGQTIFGQAATSSSGANEWASAELGANKNSDGGIQFLEVSITHADLNDAAGTQTVNIGSALPTGARILQVESELKTAFAGGSVSAATASLGVSGALTSLVNARNVFTGQGLVNALGAGTRPGGTYSAAQLQAQFSTTGANVAALTAGEITFRIAYVVR